VLPDSDGTSFDESRLRGHDLCFGPALAGPVAERKCPKLRSPRRADTGPERSGAARAPERSRIDAADHIPTGHPDIPTTVRTIKAGVDDFLTKPVSSDVLLRAIEKASARHQTFRDLKDKLDLVRARLGRLTPREREVFELVIRGDANKQIARALGCTTRTVKSHRHNVMEKMQVKSLAELVSIAERIGIASANR
jgi:DNA-binding NarL/FixJ family response regulator